MAVKKSDCVCKCKDYGKEIELLAAKIDAIELILSKPVDRKTIHKTETFYNEEPTESYEDRTLGMKYDDRIQSMKNAIAILPPNFITDGRHNKENVQAICGFMVTDEMMDAAYTDFSHEG